MCTDAEIGFFQNICDDVSCVRGRLDDVRFVIGYEISRRCFKRLSLKRFADINWSLSVALACWLLQQMLCQQRQQREYISFEWVMKQMGCDIEIYGGTHKLSVEKKGKVLYVNPGSLTGAFSPTNVQVDWSWK